LTAARLAATHHLGPVTRRFSEDHRIFDRLLRFESFLHVEGKTGLLWVRICRGLKYFCPIVAVDHDFAFLKHLVDAAEGGRHHAVTLSQLADLWIYTTD
jgi:hypothetical protein